MMQQLGQQSENEKSEIQMLPKWSILTFLKKDPHTSTYENFHLSFVQFSSQAVHWHCIAHDLAKPPANRVLRSFRLAGELIHNIHFLLIHITHFERIHITHLEWIPITHVVFTFCKKQVTSWKMIQQFFASQNTILAFTSQKAWGIIRINEWNKWFCFICKTKNQRKTPVKD